MQMAGQTRRALQTVGWATICVAATKSAGWNPWTRPNALSEIHIEEFFGLLRSQFPDSEITFRGYFNASARIARATSKKSAKKAEAVEEPPLSPEQPLGPDSRL